MQNLIFFDKEGNPLNFRYDQTLERYTGDLLFAENSSDTFKTQALYLFEKIDAFEYENQPDLSLRKFQLFNEYGFHFYQGADALKITKVEPANSDSNYRSKWIYGKKIESVFKKGRFIRFDQSVFEFTNINQIYMVVSSKPGAIMIISGMSNDVFSSTYLGNYELSAGDFTVSGVDVVGIYNYISPTLQDTLSLWNEPTFYDRIYDFRKLNIVNSFKNDDYRNTLKNDDVKIVSITNSNILDAIHLEYSVNNTSITDNSVLRIEYKSKTDLPLVYVGPIEFVSSTNQLKFGFTIPEILSPGLEFKVPNSNLNSNNFYKVSPILSFEGNPALIHYATGSQVLYQGTIYECIQSYTYSPFGLSTSVITPGLDSESQYWTKSITYLPIESSSTSGAILDESMVGGQIYLTTDTLYFSQAFTSSALVTMAVTAKKFEDEFRTLGIDLYLKNFVLKADLMYPSDYAEVNFYNDYILATCSIGVRSYVYEKCLEVSERLVQEYNYDYSENFKYNIVFTDIDEFGIVIKINKLVYSERISYVYSSGLIDLERSIDKTLRNWLTRHFLKLNTLGILPSLSTVGYASVYYNCISLQTEFPNVPLEFDVKVGTTANYYIEHSVISIFDIGKYLSLNINGRQYLEVFDTDLETTISNWIESYAEIVDDFGIFISQLASSLRVDIKKQNQRVNISVDVGKSSLPGIDTYKVLEKKQGNFGTLITSNEIILGTSSGDNSFEQEGFATGQVIGVNKTIYPLQNLEYSSIFLNPDTINLSYEGPFWGLTDSLCNSSAFTTVAFNIGFGQTGCPPQFVADLTRGMYDQFAYNTDYSIQFQTTNIYIPNSFSGVTGMVDLVYVQPVNSIFVLGDYVSVYDSFYASQVSQITIPGLTNSISLSFNKVSNYIYALSRNVLYKIDPFINQLVTTFTFSEDAYSQVINDDNGDVYVSFSNSSKVNIYSIGASTPTIVALSGFTYDMVYHDFEQDIYVRINNNVLRINGDTRTLFATYSIPGVNGPMVYDPENEQVYIFATSSLYKIDNNAAQDLGTISPGLTNSLVFNPFTSTINTITNNLEVSSINVDTDVVAFQNTTIDHGNIILNQFDGDLYVAGAQAGYILTIDSTTGVTKNLEFGGNPITRIIYNPDRKSVWGIRPQDNQILEVEVQISSYFQVETISATGVNQDVYGSLSPEYNNRDYLWLNVREYIRQPRENFNGEPKVSLYFKWFANNVPEFFMYDFSGNFLPSAGVLAYKGEKPLLNPVLNRSANRDVTRVSDSSAQQTIFDLLEYPLDYIDDNIDISTIPEPIQLFMGYNSPDEGSLRSVLQLYKKESVDFTITASLGNGDVITLQDSYDVQNKKSYAVISLSEDSQSLFTFDNNGLGRGLKSGQHLAIFLKDVTNSKNQYISSNNGYLLKVRDVFSREIVCDYFKPGVDSLTYEKTSISNFPKSGNTTYLSCRFLVWNKEIGRFNVFGQTEIEDIRYKIELNNFGKLIRPEDVYIFKEYDIKEQGVDWTYLNAKRKEMLMMKDLIYPYIGAYKSIINAINYFGYNDLELYEYYRNVDTESENFLKLFKVEIPDIFDNTVEGWRETDFINNTFPNSRYEDTNLFNLTYKITDKEGNNILLYTVEEVQKKLNGLKYWLQKNIIPITHKILDITGRADFVGVNTIVHQSRDVQIVKVHQNFTPVTFDLNEAYLLPVNSGSTVYNCVLDFKISPGLSASLLPDYYTVDIRTYEVYREWYAFKNYQKGERIVYYDKLYESAIDNNKTNNPRKFESTDVWTQNAIYEIGDIVLYDSRVYIWSGQSGATSSVVSPVLDVGVGASWFDVTEWIQIPLHPVEKISEYRPISNLYPFNFTIDSNISPYLVIEVTSDNGYGLIYRDRKNYEIKGILDIQELEAFTNLTTKQYRNATLPEKFVNVASVPNLVLSKVGLGFNSQVLDLSGNPTWRIYLSTYGTVVYPNILHEFVYLVGNSASTESCSSFRLEMSGDFIDMNNPYVVSSQGTAYFSGSDLYWNGSLNPGSTVQLNVRAEVTNGGRAFFTQPKNTQNNQAYVSQTYSVNAKMSTGVNFGATVSVVGNLNSTRYILYDRSPSPGPISLVDWPTSPTQLFSSGGNGPANGWSFSLSSVTQSGIQIITTPVTFSTNFVEVVDGFNEVLGDFGYIYYQGRIRTNYFPSILMSTYYSSDPVLSTVTNTRLTNAGPVTYNEPQTTDSTGLLFGTNSSSGSPVTTITHSYYPG